jgi:predicted transcriptional regulator
LTQGTSHTESNRVEPCFTPEIKAKIFRLTAEQGYNGEGLVAEAVDRFIEHNEWCVEEIEKGLDAACRGELFDHEDIRR